VAQLELTAAELTLLPQPTLLIGVEERVHEVVAVVLWNLKRFSLYALIQALKTERLTYTHKHLITVQSPQSTATPGCVHLQAIQHQQTGRFVNELGTLCKQVAVA
jgi:hypothetical protein